MNESIRKIVKELEQPGPRYTSYPTAPVWKNEFPVSQFKSGLENQIQEGTSLSFYVHLPFCEKLCHFCACNKVIDPNRRQSDSYQDALRAEINLVSKSLGGRGLIEQMHWGGGTPTFFSAKELEDLFRFLEKRLRWSSDPEISIEANPVVTKKEHLHALARLGFNRLSMGVQDFDARVQDAINRHQTFEQTKILVEEARHFEFKSINFDLIYGLPLQSIETISKTVEQVLILKPERIAFYSFANVPWKHPFQRRFNDKDLLKGPEKISLYLTARELLLNAGYLAIGMDHFALPDDELSVAQKNQKLHRNFMGYTTKGHTELIGMGVSAISTLSELYTQNLRTLPPYYESLRRNEFPIERGIQLTLDDKIRRYVITELMCNFSVNLQSIEAIFGVEFHSYFKKEKENLNALIEKHLIVTDAFTLKVTPIGELLVRNIAMTFDAYLSALPKESLFSQTI